MQFKFLTLYHNFSNEEKNLVEAQRSLLSVWQNAVFEGKIKFTPKATVEFKAYSFFEYPDSNKAIKEIKASYGHKNKQTKEIEYWWGGKQYPSFDALYSALAEQKRFMELTITTEDYYERNY